jgi:C-terminal processing protease CtpA/Prc
MKISVQTGGIEEHIGTDACYQLIHEAGFDAVDVNLDHVFDERDTLLDKKVYCLISPVSFSCGNLVPCVLKTAPNVTLLGKSSGGGSCVVLPMSNAGGAVFQISAPLHLSYAKNGSYYDIDQGAEPDYYIDSIESFYDRERLTDFINSLL